MYTRTTDEGLTAGCAGQAAQHQEIEPQDLGPVRISVSDVRMALHNLAKSIETLRLKCAPAMATVAGDNKATSGNVKPTHRGSSSIGLEIDDLAAMTAELNWEVVSIIDGIEL